MVNGLSLFQIVQLSDLGKLHILQNDSPKPPVMSVLVTMLLNSIGPKWSLQLRKFFLELVFGDCLDEAI